MRLRGHALLRVPRKLGGLPARGERTMQMRFWTETTTQMRVWTGVADDAGCRTVAVAVETHGCHGVQAGHEHGERLGDIAAESG